jgi:hypothetical protein
LFVALGKRTRSAPASCTCRRRLPSAVAATDKATRPSARLPAKISLCAGAFASKSPPFWQSPAALLRGAWKERRSSPESGPPALGLLRFVRNDEIKLIELCSKSPSPASMRLRQGPRERMYRPRRRDPSRRNSRRVRAQSRDIARPARWRSCRASADKKWRGRYP